MAPVFGKDMCVYSFKFPLVCNLLRKRCCFLCVATHGLATAIVLHSANHMEIANVAVDGGGSMKFVVFKGMLKTNFFLNRLQPLLFGVGLGTAERRYLAS